MVKYLIKISISPILSVLLAFSCLLFACSSSNNKPLLIHFSADSTSIVFENIDRPGLLQLKSMEGQDSILNDLISVLQTPSESDTTIKELPLPGKMLVTDTSIVFTPEQPFLKGNDYLVITYLNARFGTPEQVLKAQLNTAVKPHQMLLTR
ncbi:MAG: hypothetical protein EOP48_28395 [Sphingobacteriales bacterium]|nr:MAG: hypothetical protein EOP48_28395 [Sphingobacteriales bacterium]